MNKAFTRLVIVLLGVLSINSVFAKPAGWARDRGFHGWYLGGGYTGGYGWGGYHSSTEAEGYLRGMGAYFDGLGNLRVNTAIAHNYLQQAYTQYLNNSKLRLQVYYERKEMHDAYWAKKNPPMTQEKRDRIAKMGLPARLAAGDRNYSTGALKWPAILKGDEYRDDRAEIEKLFSERAEKPDQAGAGSQNCRDIQAAVDEMAEAHKAKIHEMVNADFIAGSRFLKTLRYEAKFKP